MQVSTVLITASPKGTLVYESCISIIQVNLSLHSYLPGNSMNEAGQVVILDLTVFRPGSKPPKFTVVAIVCHPHLRAYKQDLPVVDYDAAVIDHILVSDRPT